MDKYDRRYSKKKHGLESGQICKVENSYATKLRNLAKKSVNSIYELKPGKHTHTSKGESQAKGEPPDEGPDVDPETETVVV